MSNISIGQNSECRDRESPVKMCSKRDDQRHRLRAFYTIPVPAVLPAVCLLLSSCAMVHDVGPVFMTKISIRIGISNSYCQILVEVFGRSPCWNIHCPISVVMINSNQHINWTRELFKSFPREVGSSHFFLININIRMTPSPCK